MGIQTTFAGGNPYSLAGCVYPGSTFYDLRDGQIRISPQDVIDIWFALHVPAEISMLDMFLSKQSCRTEDNNLASPGGHGQFGRALGNIGYPYMSSPNQQQATNGIVVTHTIFGQIIS